MADNDETSRRVAEAFSSVLKERRKALGLTQEQFCERADLTWKHYQALEAGFTSYRDRKPANPRLDMLRKLAGGFEITVPELMAEVFDRADA